MIRFATFTALAPAVLLGGCVSFGGEVPDSLITLTATASAPAGAEATPGEQGPLALVEFETPKALDVTRVPVQVSPTEIAYLQDAVWVERPARLFRRLVGETVRTRSGRMVIDGDDPGAGATDRLHGTLREFGYDAATSSVVVVFDAVRNGSDNAISTRRFEARVSGVQADVDAVAPALNRAANDVAGQIADWLG